jgi:site-specific recombinase XerD
MKTFESALSSELEAFIDYRKSLGYAIEPTRSFLMIFDKYLKKKKANLRDLSTAFFLQMRADLKMEPTSINRILYNACYFFRYLVRINLFATNPLEDLPPLPENTFVPYIFSPEQIDQLLDATVAKIRKHEKYFLKDFGEYLAIGMMARCGMRISEPLHLLEKHYRRDERTLYIKKTKFKKDRLIPIPQSLAQQIDNYLSIRRALNDNDQNPYLLIGWQKSRLLDSKVRIVFNQAVKKIGLDQQRRVVADTVFARPTPHSLRHSFAANTLKRAMSRGISPQNALPVLAVYMGHKKYKHTLKYLKMLDAEHRNNFNNFFS